MSDPVVIAIDGPAASGKSSTAARVSERLGLAHIDSGSLYRALTWVGLTHGVAGSDAILAAAMEAELRLTKRGRDVIVVAGAGRRDIEAAIRAGDVTAGVSAVAALPAVRDWVNLRLRNAVREVDGAVLDGRDIGTVVFPDAPLKVFLTASPVARALRRLQQRGGRFDGAEIQAEAERLAKRDLLDASRVVAPLRQAPDAVVVDSTDLGFDSQVEQIVELARKRGLLAP